MRKLPLIKIAGAAAALMMLGLLAGCQSRPEAETVAPAYVVGVTPFGMRLDPIIWGTITRFDIASVDGEAANSKSRVTVPPGQHTLVITAASGWSGRANSSKVTLDLKSGHTYLLRPTNIGGLIYVMVIDNDAGVVVYRPEVAPPSVEEVPEPRAAPVAVVAAAMPAPVKAESVQYGSDGSVKAKSTSEEGRIVISKVFDGTGKLEYTETSYYAGDGRIVRKDRRDADGKLEKVVVYFDAGAKVLDQDGTVIGTEDAAK